MSKKIEIGGENRLFIINNLDYDDNNLICQFGTGMDRLDITITKNGGLIQSIECIDQNNIAEMEFALPEPANLIETKIVGYIPKGYEDFDLQNCGNFKLVFNSHELDIFLSEDLNPTKVCVNDRVEYYMDENNVLLYVRIRNLDQKEYNFLKNKKRNREIKTKVVLKLSEIELQENVQIIDSGLIGSQSWGCSSVESDYDLRFIYLRSLNEYLSLENKKSNISYDINEKWDVLGWDLKKFIGLLTEQNASAYEMLYSPIKFQESTYLMLLKGYAEKIFNKNKMINQYLYIIKARINDLNANLRNQKPTHLKSILYVLRLICMVNYINEKGDFPVCNFETLLSVSSNQYLKNDITNIIDAIQKGQNIELTKNIIEYLMIKYEEVKNLMTEKIENSIIDSQEIDNLFIEGLIFYGKNINYSLNNNPIPKQTL